MDKHWGANVADAYMPLPIAAHDRSLELHYVQFTWVVILVAVIVLVPDFFNRQGFCR